MSDLSSNNLAAPATTATAGESIEWFVLALLVCMHGWKRSRKFACFFSLKSSCFIFLPVYACLYCIIIVTSASTSAQTEEIGMFVVRLISCVTVVFSRFLRSPASQTA
jgi:hypothetical protein